MKRPRLLLLSALALRMAWAQHVGDELFSVEVTSVGRKAEKLSKASAAVCRTFVFRWTEHL